MVSIKEKKNEVIIFVFGLAISMVVAVMGIGIISYCINKQLMDIDKITVPVFLLRSIAISSGAIYSCAKSKYKHVVTATIHGAMCLTVFLINTIIILNDQLHGVIAGLISVIVGTYLPCVVGFHKKKGIKQVKYKVRNR